MEFLEFPGIATNHDTKFDDPSRALTEL